MISGKDQLIILEGKQNADKWVDIVKCILNEKEILQTAANE